MRIALLLASVLGLAGSASAATIIVPRDQPTIQAAASAAAPGDTIVVLKGAYTENVVMAAAGVHLVGRGAILDGNVAGVNGDALTVNADNVVVQGFVVRNGNNGIVIGANGVQVLACSFRNAASDAINATGNGLVVDKCRFTGLSGSAVNVTGNTASMTRCLVSRTGNRGFLVTGTGVHIDSNVLFQLDDSNGMNITGDDAVVTRNRLTMVDNTGILINGNNADVEQNVGDRIDQPLLSITGTGALVQKNASSYNRGGLSVVGDGARVLSNRVVRCTSSAAISVTGDSVTVTGNLVTDTMDDSDAVQVFSNTATGGGTVQSNRVTDCAGTAFNLNGTNLVLTSDSAVRCSQDHRAAFSVVGNGNTLTGCLSTESDNRGFAVNGNSNSIVSCKALNALADGFHVTGGTNNTFDTCFAFGCGGEGFDNRGTNTQLLNGAFLKNRIDIANDANGGATFLGGLTTVKHKTGGATTQPEVD